jgi:hypothetical protein
VYFLSILVLLVPGAMAGPTDGSLQWDATEKFYQAQAGESSAVFLFTARNETDTEIVVTAVETSCRCTQAQFSSAPCRIGPHKSAELLATVRFPGQWGKITQIVYVESAAGNTELTLTIQAPKPVSH